MRFVPALESGMNVFRIEGQCSISGCVDAAADAVGAFIGLLLSMVFWKR